MDALRLPRAKWLFSARILPQEKPRDFKAIGVCARLVRQNPCAERRPPAKVTRTSGNDAQQLDKSNAFLCFAGQFFQLPQLGPLEAPAMMTMWEFKGHFRVCVSSAPVRSGWELRPQLMLRGHGQLAVLSGLCGHVQSFAEARAVAVPIA